MVVYIVQISGFYCFEFSTTMLKLSYLSCSQQCYFTYPFIVLVVFIVICVIILVLVLKVRDGIASKFLRPYKSPHDMKQINKIVYDDQTK